MCPARRDRPSKSLTRNGCHVLIFENQSLIETPGFPVFLLGSGVSLLHRL